MTSFIIIALLITLVTLGLLIWPLRKNRNSVSYARQAQNIHYAKERIQELDQQLQNASISATDYEALKLEIENTLADDIDIAKHNESNENNDSTLNTPKSNKHLIALLCIVLPISALGFYYFVGTPESFSLAKQSPSQQRISLQNQRDQGQTQADNEQVNQMLLTIEQRLKEQPSDVEGWNILATTYMKLGRYNDAKRSMINLMKIKGESAASLTSIADATGFAAGGNLIGEPQELLARALAIDPNYQQALWMSGLASVQAKDNASTIKYWERLLPLLNDSPQQQENLSKLLQQARTGLAASQANEQSSQAAASESSQPKDDQVTSDKNTSKGVVSKGLRVSISIDPSMIEKTQPSDLVFVFAKATKGPPAPLAVKRLTVADLPLTVNLTDEDAMVPQFKLSLFENISISARVAKSGNPIAQTGDIESTTADVKNTTTKEIKLVISSEIK